MQERDKELDAIEIEIPLASDFGDWIVALKDGRYARIIVAETIEELDPTKPQMDQIEGRMGYAWEWLTN